MNKNNFYYKLWEYSQNIKLVKEIANNFSKENIYIPKVLTENHRLNGFGDVFKKFMNDNYKGKTIYIPRYIEEDLIELINNNNKLFRNLKTIVVSYLNNKRK